MSRLLVTMQRYTPRSSDVMLLMCNRPRSRSNTKRGSEGSGRSLRVHCTAGCGEPEPTHSRVTWLPPTTVTSFGAFTMRGRPVQSRHNHMNITQIQKLFKSFCKPAVDTCFNVVNASWLHCVTSYINCRHVFSHSLHGYDVGLAFTGSKDT